MSVGFGRCPFLWMVVVALQSPCREFATPVSKLVSDASIYGSFFYLAPKRLLLGAFLLMVYLSERELSSFLISRSPQRMQRSQVLHR